MKRILVLSFLAFLLATEASSQIRKRDTRGGGDVSYSNPKEYVIGDIEVIGLNQLDENALISLTGLKIGDRIKVPGDDISGAINKLYKHGLVGDVSIYIGKIEGEEVTLILELTERPRLTGFTFEGVKKAHETELREDLNLIRGRILTDAIVRNAQMAVKNYYVKKGHLNANVNVVQEYDTANNNGVQLKLVVDPKRKVKIEDIQFLGNENFIDAKLRGQLKNTKEKARIRLFGDIAKFITNPKKIGNWLTERDSTSWEEVENYLTDKVKPNFLSGSKFIKSDFEDDKKAVISFYNSKGFRDARIISDSIIYNDNNTIDIVIRIDEGNKYYFREIYWKGNFVHSENVLNRILDINKGDVYNNDLITKKISFNPKGPDISGLYMDDGYLFFDIQPVEIGVEGDSIDIEMRIYEGDQAIIDEVRITGNNRTRDHVIRRELLTVPGQKFSRTDLIVSQQRLGQMGFFNPQGINPVPIPNPADGTVDIEWAVQEQSSDQIELSGGWGGAFGFVGTLGLTLNNFSVKSLSQGKFTPVPMGDGQRLSIRAQANGRQYQNYSFSFTEPWLGGKKPNSFTISYNHSVLRTTTAESETRFDYRGSLRLNSFSVGLGRRLEWPDNNFVLSNSIGYTQYILENYAGRGLGFTDGTSNSFTVNANLSRNSIDNMMFPTRGSSISINVSLTPPYSAFKEDNFWRLSGTERTALTQQLDEQLTDGSEVPFSERDPLAFESRLRNEITKTENAEKYNLIEYHKWMLDFKYYIPLNKKLVIETNAHFGFIGSYGDRVGVGPFERFYLGGDGLAGQNFILGTEVISLRGYENNKVTPPYDEIPVAERIMGGIVYNKFSMELRQAITTGQAATIYGFVFVEGGNNWDNYQEFNPFDLYKSAGFGARIFMPAFGLIGLNWGYGFDTLPGAIERSGGQFHFTIGQQIR
ncbi:MAG: BamA/OMP85 family outer membrane protein [Candidatus Cyclobacteriaceae bacterium M2_1C_046]